MNDQSTSPQRILVIGWPEAGSQASGAGVVTRHITASLRAAGKEVREFQPQMTEAPSPSDEIAPPPFLGPYSSAETIKQSNAITRTSADQGDNQSTIDSTTREITKRTVEKVQEIDFTPDLVHVHDWLGFESAKLIAETTSAPVILHVHSTEMERFPGAPNTEIMQKEEQAANDADGIIAVSKRSAEILNRIYDVPNERITIIEPGSAGEESPPVRSARFPEFTALFLGRITRQKGPFFFLELASKLLNADVNWRFIIAGDGNLLPELIQESADRNLANRIHFCGHVTPQERARLFSISDVLVAPFVSEPFGLVPLEAVRSGLPTVVSRQSGIADWLPDSQLVDYWDVEGMAKQLRTLRDDPDAIVATLAAAQSSIDQLTTERAMAQLRTCYQAAIRRNQT